MVVSRVVVMGVSGCGKSTLGRSLATTLGLRYVEGDDLHPPANVQRMAAGVPLTDADRLGWLAQVAQQLADSASQREGVIVACSALKRRYRDQLRAAAPDVRFVHLHGDPQLLQQRLAQRRGHYMPASLLDSQLQTLEPPQADEHAVTLDIADAPQVMLDGALRGLNLPPGGGNSPPTPQR